jgi:DNA (cytosine-5)-methyltransferase 1
LEPGTGELFCKYTEPANEYLKKTKIRTNSKYVTQHIARPLNQNDKEIYKIATNKMIFEKKRLNYTDLPKRLKKHKNDSIFTNRFQVVSPFSLSHTVVAHISCDGNYYIYPDLKQTRSISIREAARIQSFPDNYYFEGGQTAAFKQIGNAVPPLMAAGIAVEIKKRLIYK